MSDTTPGVRPRLGYIGLGAMGGAMVEAACAAGWAPRVYDLDPGRVETAVAAGAAAASDPAAVARASDVVGVCVPAAEHVEAVLGGPDGLVTGAADRPTDAGDLVVLVHSTVAADDIRRWHAAFRRARIAVHDAAVAGGAAAARAGDLVLLVGGLADVDPAARGVLDAYAGLVLDAGPVGAGAVLKLAVNVMTYAQQAAAAAAWDLVADAGGDPTLLLE
ncbi:MAG: NAD(P)-dependent oxidoreductase, partial [Actinomyces sp.]